MLVNELWYMPWQGCNIQRQVLTNKPLHWDMIISQEKGEACQRERSWTTPPRHGKNEEIKNIPMNKSLTTTTKAGALGAVRAAAAAAAPSATSSHAYQFSTECSVVRKNLSDVANKNFCSQLWNSWHLFPLKFSMCVLYYSFTYKGK